MKKQNGTLGINSPDRSVKRLNRSRTIINIIEPVWTNSRGGVRSEGSLQKSLPNWSHQDTFYAVAFHLQTRKFCGRGLYTKSIMGRRLCILSGMVLRKRLVQTQILMGNKMRWKASRIRNRMYRKLFHANIPCQDPFYAAELCLRAQSS